MREVLLRLEELLFLADPGIRAESVEEDGEGIRVGVRCRTAGARCPGCRSWSGRVHGSYLRFPADLPVAGRQVVLRLRVRRFTGQRRSVGRGRSPYGLIPNRSVNESRRAIQSRQVLQSVIAPQKLDQNLRFESS
ncbi:transposase family protein [Streptomyces sp. NPDC057575]|uniref:transposase family protein n=1 Tax=unclassified Streptomyces TaxID=2593676 RepID=UPI0036B1540A